MFTSLIWTGKVVCGPDGYLLLDFSWSVCVVGLVLTFLRMNMKCVEIMNSVEAVRIFIVVQGNKTFPLVLSQFSFFWLVDFHAELSNDQSDARDLNLFSEKIFTITGLCNFSKSGHFWDKILGESRFHVVTFNHVHHHHFW